MQTYQQEGLKLTRELANSAIDQAGSAITAEQIAAHHAAEADDGF